MIAVLLALGVLLMLGLAFRRSARSRRMLRKLNQKFEEGQKIEEMMEEIIEEEIEEEETIAEQQDLLPEKKSGRGRFDKATPSVTDDGEDLDVPSFLRKKKK